MPQYRQMYTNNCLFDLEVYNYVLKYPGENIKVYYLCIHRIFKRITV